MANSPGASDSGASPLNAPAAAAHDVFNLLTVVYGLLDDVESLPNELAARAGLVDQTKVVASRLEDIGRRLVDQSRAARQSAQEGGAGS
jgi:hypothetical protein